MDRQIIVPIPDHAFPHANVAKGFTYATVNVKRNIVDADINVARVYLMRTQNVYAPIIACYRSRCVPVAIKEKRE